MRRIAFLVVLVFPLVLTVEPAPAKEKKPTDELAEARDKALVKAFRFLDERLYDTPLVNGTARRSYSMATAGLAYLLAADKAGKKLPSRRSELDRIVKDLARYAEQIEKLSGKSDPRQAGMVASFQAAQFCWPLGVSGHFFAECMARKKFKRPAYDALKSIVAILELAQQSNGGWGHDDASRPGLGLPTIRIPKPWGGGETTYPGTLLAASNCALSGLGLAHHALRLKRKGPLDRGRAYYASAQSDNGTFPYDPGQKHGGATGIPKQYVAIERARTAGGVFALYCAGSERDDPVAVKALAAVDEQPEDMSQGHGSATLALHFGALLSNARGDRAWATFREIFLPRILEAQEASGAFTCVCRPGAAGVTCDTAPMAGVPMADRMAEEGKVQVTAVHTLILMLDRTAPKAVPLMPAPAGETTPREK